MLRLRCQLHRFAWVAFLAIFGLVVAPTISHARAYAQGGSAWAEVCTPQGMKRVVAPPDSAELAPVSAPDSVVSHLDHCPLCGLSVAAAALPSAPAAFGLPLTEAKAVPALFLQSPRPLFIWAAARPRGPPTRA